MKKVGMSTSQKKSDTELDALHDLSLVLLKRDVDLDPRVPEDIEDSLVQFHQNIPEINQELIEEKARIIETGVSLEKVANSARQIAHLEVKQEAIENIDMKIETESVQPEACHGLILILAFIPGKQVAKTEIEIEVIKEVILKEEVIIQPRMMTSLENHKLVDQLIGIDTKDVVGKIQVTMTEILAPMALVLEDLTHEENPNMLLKTEVKQSPVKTEINEGVENQHLYQTQVLIMATGVKEGKVGIPLESRLARNLLVLQMSANT